MEGISEKRSRNFSRVEVNLLIDIVVKYKNIVENKRTDGVTWREKGDAWEKIAEEFNAVCGSFPRSGKTIRAKYEALKKKTRKTCALIKHERAKTGGGSANCPKLEDYDEKILGLTEITMLGLPPLFEEERISVVQQEEAHCSWQTIEIPLNENDSDLGEEPELIENEVLPAEEPTSPVEHPNVPKRGVKRHGGFRINQSNRKSRKLPDDDLVDLKRTVLNLQKNLLEEEKRQKIEINKLTIENLKLDIELKKARLKILQRCGDREFEDELDVLLGRK